MKNQKLFVQKQENNNNIIIIHYEKGLKRTALPSITGFEADAPMFPNPSTVVPLVIIPKVFALLV